MTARPEFYRFHNGDKAPLPFETAEYEARLAGLRKIIAETGVTACVLTSMHNVAYYSGFLYGVYPLEASILRHTPYKMTAYA